MRSTIRLLLVEDDDIQVVLFRELVRRLGDLKLAVDDVPTLAEGQHRLDTAEYDLIITDLSLPDSTGMATLDGLLAHAGGLPLVVLSGESVGVMTPEALRRGAQGFLSKHDVTGTELRRVVEQSIMRKNYVDEVVTDKSRDPLTGVWDRSAFWKLLESAQRSNKQYAVVFFDVNDFKIINDTLGHSAGDEVLVGVVSRMRGAIRDSDAIGRWGGDEFAVLATGISDVTQLRELCLRANKAVNSDTVLNSGRTVGVTVSCGAAMARQGDNPQDVLEAADGAMYVAKKQGIRVPYFADSVALSNGFADANDSLPDRPSTADVLSDAEFWYQPMVNVASNQIWGYEALARWGRAESDSTAENLRRLIRSPLAPDFATHTIELTCRALVEQLTVNRSDHIISFNLHAAQFADPLAVASGVEAAIGELPLRASQVQIELTEAATLSRNPEAIALLWRLHEQGVRIAIDDFCDEQSSFEMLMKLPVDTIKLDRTITSRLPDNATAVRIVRAMVVLCEGSIDLVAEGVETAEQRDHLRAAGINLQQGFLHGRPTKLLPQIVRPRDGKSADQRILTDHTPTG